MSTLKAAGMAALERIGTTPTTRLKGEGALDSAAHAFLLAGIGRSWFSTAHEKAKEAMVATLDKAMEEKLLTTRQSVLNTRVATNVIIGEGKAYMITAQVNPGPSYLDENILKLALTERLEARDIETIFARAKRYQHPTVTYSVAERT